MTSFSVITEKMKSEYKKYESLFVIDTDTTSSVITDAINAAIEKAINQGDKYLFFLFDEMQYTSENSPLELSDIVKKFETQADIYFCSTTIEGKKVNYDTIRDSIINKEINYAMCYDLAIIKKKGYAVKDAEPYKLDASLLYKMARVANVKFAFVDGIELTVKKETIEPPVPDPNPSLFPLDSDLIKTSIEEYLLKRNLRTVAALNCEYNYCANCLNVYNWINSGLYTFGFLLIFINSVINSDLQDVYVQATKLAQNGVIVVYVHDDDKISELVKSLTNTMAKLRVCTRHGKCDSKFCYDVLLY
jgi:hypothetical protein